MKSLKLTTLAIVGIALPPMAIGFFYINSESKDISMKAKQLTTKGDSQEQKSQQTNIELQDRPGEVPDITSGIPHIQLNQTSGDEMYDRLTAQTYAIAGIVGQSSQASLPGARAIAVAPELPINQDAMIVGREFAHIHASPGRGSLHLVLSADDAAAIVDKGWGEYHPYSLDGTRPGMVMIFAPRDDQDLKALISIINASFEFATSH